MKTYILPNKMWANKNPLFTIPPLKTIAGHLYHGRFQ